MRRDEGFEARPRGRGRCERRARPSSRAGGPAPSPCVARSLTTPVGAGEHEEVGARCPKGRRASSHSEGGPAITRTGRHQARALPPAAGCLRRRFRSMSVPDAAGTGRSRRQASRGGPAIVAAAAVAGPNEDGPGVGGAAERGRCRRRRASPPPVRVDVGPRRRGDRPISPGSVSGRSDDRGGGGDGRAERGWTSRCCRRGTRGPPRPAGVVPPLVGRGEAPTRRAASAAAGVVVLGGRSGRHGICLVLAVVWWSWGPSRVGLRTAGLAEDYEPT